MNRVPCVAAVLPVAVLLASGVVHAQARGPAAADILENGQKIVRNRELRVSPYLDYWDKPERDAQQAWRNAREQFEKERAELADPAVRASKLADMDLLLQRIPGRFRIAGVIKKLEFALGGGVTMVSGEVTGVADCTGIGEGVGVQCILNATWPVIEIQVPEFSRRNAPPPPPTEMLRTIKPAALVLGLNLDPPGIRAQMVDAESLTHTWVGQQAGNTVWASRVNRALPGRLINQLQVSAEPDSEVVTIVLRTGLIVIVLTMHHDPAAQAEKPLKSLRSR